MTKQAKRKPQAKAKGRNTRVKIADLSAPKGQAVKGGGGKKGTTTTGGIYMKYGSIQGSVTTGGFKDWIE